MAAGKSRAESGVVGMAFDADGTILAAEIDYLEDAGAYPIPWPVGTGMATGMLFPGPYRVPRASFGAKFDVHQHRGAHRVPRAVAVRVGGP